MQIAITILVLAIIFLAQWGRNQLSAKLKFYVSMVSAILLMIMVLLYDADWYWPTLLMLVVISAVYTNYKAYKAEQQGKSLG